MLLDYIGSLNNETDEQIIKRFEQAKADSANSWILDGKRIYDEAHLTDIPYTNIEWHNAIQITKYQELEPKYPTWAEWLNSMGLIKHDTGQFCVRMPNQYSYEVKEVDILNEVAYKPIPADIAERLGIGPKEE